MKRLFVATTVALLLFAPLTFSTAPTRPLPDSGAWHDFSETVNEDQRYFAKYF